MVISLLLFHLPYQKIFKHGVNTKIFIPARQISREVEGTDQLSGKINIQPIFAYMTVYFRKIYNSDDPSAFHDG